VRLAAIRAKSMMRKKTNDFFSPIKVSASVTNVIFVKKFMIYIFALNCKNKQDMNRVLQVRIKNDEERMSVVLTIHV